MRIRKFLENELKKRPMVLVGLFLLILSLARLSVAFPSLYRNDLDDIKNANISGKVYKIEEKTNSTAYYLKTEDLGKLIVYSTNKVNGIDITDGKNKANGTDIANDIDKVSGTDIDNGTDIADGTDNVSIKTGNTIIVHGDYKVYRRPGNPGQFDMKKYYAVRKIFGSMYAEDITIIDPSINHLPQFLSNIRNLLNTSIESVFDKENAGIIKAMITGSKNTLPEEIKDLYSSCGIAHIIAISGLHISFLASITGRILKKILGFKYGTISSIFIVLFYVILSGASPSSVRAYLFFLISMIGELLGRGRDLPSAYFLSFGLMVTANPFYLLESGFWLSYTAIGGIVIPGRILIKKDPEERYMRGDMDELVNFYGSDTYRSDVYGIGIYSISNYSIVKKLSRSKEFLKSLKESIYMGLIMQVVMFPLLLFYYYTYCPYSLLLNLLVIPAMPVVLGSGFISMLAGLLFSPAGKLCAIPAELVLRGYRFLCETSMKLPGGTLIIGKPAVWKVFLSYFFMILALVFISFKNEITKKNINKFINVLKKESLKNISYILIIFSIAILIISPKNKFELSVLDVGQGDCIYFCDGSGRNYLCDCGSSDEKSIAKYRILPFLKSKGVRKLNGIFISHGDSDHINGIEEILNMKNTGGIQIESLIMTKQLFESETGKRLCSEADMNDIPVYLMNAGNQIMSNSYASKHIKKNKKYDDLTIISCIYPARDLSISGEENNGSMVLSIVNNNFSALLTGDLEAEGERTILQNGDIENVYIENNFTSYTILKVGHHGSSSSSDREFLEAVSPDAAVISCGRNNRYGHPHEETVERLKEYGCKILSTQDSGAVIFKLSDISLFSNFSMI